MAQDLLLELHRRGVRLRLVDGRLDVLAPAGALTDDLRLQLRSQRGALVDLLGRSGPARSTAELVPDPAGRYEPFPLTDIQHAYWVGRHSAVELGGVATHFYVELEQAGLDPDRLARSLRRVIDRHDMLRAVIDRDGRQRVLPEVPPYEIAMLDLTGATPAEQEAAFAGVRAQMAHRVLPADRWPLFEIRVSRLDGDRLRLHVSIDLLIADAYSMRLLFADWRRFYEHPQDEPEPLAVSFRDHVLAAAAAGGEEVRQAEAYWTQRLDTLPPAPALPLAVQPGQLSRTEFTRRRTRVPRDRWTEIKRRAAGRGLTPSVVLATAFSDVLRLWSAQQRFTLNLSLFNRPPEHPQIGSVIGDFTSVTLLEVDAGPGESFTGRAARLQAQLMRDLEHLAYSGVRVQRELARRSGGGPAATMPIVFTSALPLGPGDEAADVAGFFGGTGFFGAFRYGISQTPQVWLDHQVAEEQGELYINWDAVEALFPAGLLDDMFAAYQDRLLRLGRDDDLWDGPAPVPLPGWQVAERERANATAAPIPERTLSELVEEQVVRSPDATAVVAADGVLSYGELAGRAHRLARRLAALGAERDTLVAVVLPRGAGQAAAVLGVCLSGAGYLPIDPDWPTARRRLLLEQGRVRTVVTTPALRDEPGWPAGLHLVTADDPEVVAADPGPPEGGPSPGDLAYVIFTSGSTGTPKGVMVDHRSAANTVQDLNARFGVGPGDRVLALSALSFDLSVYDLFGVLGAGGTVVVPAPTGAQDPGGWTELVRRHGVTMWNSVPALMQAWLDSEPPAGAGDSLRLVMLSGDWIPVTQPDAIRAHCPRARLVSLGGATEAAIWSILFPIGSVPPEWLRIPYGRPLANQTMHVLDERLAPCPVWTVGEICIGGAGLARGYWADPDRTAERFVLQPGTGRRLYRTGDRGRYLPGGDIEFLGRADSQVKLNGYRIELGEIAAVLRSQPGVREALVDVDTNPGTGRRQLVAYVVPDRAAEPGGPGAPPAEPAVAAGRRERLAAAGTAAAELVDYRTLLDRFNGTTVPLVALTLARLGVGGRAGEPVDADSLVERHGVQARYGGLLRQWLALLARRGLLVPAGPAGVYRCVEPFDQAALGREVAAGLAALPTGGAHGTLAGYFARCSGSQLELLRGTVNLLEFLVPDGSTAVTDAMYADNALSRVQNAVVARVVGEFAAGLPAGRPVRVVEVGAGSGATSAQLLPELPPGSSYLFTDVSTYFTERARARFAAQPAVRFGLYDINRPPAEQGLAPASADVVIGANVLHNARDLGCTLRELRTVLCEGGLLVLVENTVNEPFHLVTVGFYQDFGAYRDGREVPLLSAAQWREELAAAGLRAAGEIPGDEADPLGQHVLVAAAPGGAAALDPAALREAAAAQLPAYMVPQHVAVLDRPPLGPNGKVDLAAAPRPWHDVPAGTVRPRDIWEERIAGIWREALVRADFGVLENFFELGGDSLHAVRIIDRLRSEFGVEVTADEGLQLLFDSPTVAELAATLRQRAGG